MEFVIKKLSNIELLRPLQQLGFEKRELDIYLALYQQGPASIRDIAQRAQYNRGTTYEVLKELQHRGIVSYFPKGKRKYFSAENPRVFVELAQEKREALDQTILSIESDIVPELEKQKPEFEPANVHYYEGDDGIEFVLKDILNSVAASEDNTYYVYSSKPIRKYLYRPFPTYTKQRVKKGINVKVIAIGAGGEDAPLSERKWISVESDKIAACYTAIYPPKYASISLAHGDYPTAVVIDAPEIAESQKIVFETLWERL